MDPGKTFDVLPPRNNQVIIETGLGKILAPWELLGWISFSVGNPKDHKYYRYRSKM